VPFSIFKLDFYAFPPFKHHFDTIQGSLPKYTHYLSVASKSFEHPSKPLPLRMRINRGDPISRCNWQVLSHAIGIQLDFCRHLFFVPIL